MLLSMAHGSTDYYNETLSEQELLPHDFVNCCHKSRVCRGNNESCGMFVQLFTLSDTLRYFVYTTVELFSV